MLSINTNISSLITQSSMKQSTDKLNQAIERMTTGFKINHAKDNAANYSIATNMTTKINSYMVAEDNAAMGLDMTTAISENLDLINQHASRIRDLCEQASNGTYGEESLKAIQAEIESRMTEIERIKANAEFNGIKLFDVQETEISKFLKPVTKLTEDEAIAQGYTVVKTADELAAAINNSDSICLMNDIDLTGYASTYVGGGVSSQFTTAYNNATLNGNGYSITVSGSDASVYSFLNSTQDSGFKNLELTFKNSISSNIIGLISYAQGNVTIDNCTVNGTVKPTHSLTGLVESNYGTLTIKDTCIDIISNGSSTVLVPFVNYENGTTTIENSFYIEEVFGVGTNSVSKSELQSLLPRILIGNNLPSQEIHLQIGINSNQNSQITMQLVALETLTSIDASSSTTARNSLNILDNFIANISKSQTEIGAVQNRLESVLEEITIQRDNLISSRSTIRDADIAEVSSHYIQQQILQQASATLLATANQSPSIALQLI